MKTAPPVARAKPIAINIAKRARRSIERMMAKKYRLIVFVEPTNNPIIRWAAKRGLAQRVG